jgi:DNA-binding FadR family transcriptional regulator
MHLSDSHTVSHLAPAIGHDALLGTWCQLTALCAAHAAFSATGEDIRSLRVLLDEAGSESETSAWSSLMASVYVTICEAAHHGLYESVVLDLWQRIDADGFGDVVLARLWDRRVDAERTLRQVVSGIAGVDADRAHAAMTTHLTLVRRRTVGR